MASPEEDEVITTDARTLLARERARPLAAG